MHRKEQTQMSYVPDSKEINDHCEDDQNTLGEWDLSVRSFRCLERAGIIRPEQLIKISADELKSIRNLGRKSAREIVFVALEKDCEAWANEMMKNDDLFPPDDTTGSKEELIQHLLKMREQQKRA